MSNAPYFLPKARAGMRLGHGEIKDHMFYDGLEDAYTGDSMGVFAQATSDEQLITRKEMDSYALRSLSRASQAIEAGFFSEEIEPVEVKSRAGITRVLNDEQPAKARPEKIPELKPAFASGGSITAANCSSISDGAAALVLMSAARAKELGISPLANHAGNMQEYSVA